MSSPKIDAGLKRLCARQSPGEVFSPSQIARECGCDDQAITYHINRALSKVAVLMADDPELRGALNRMFTGSKVTEVTEKCAAGKFREQGRKVGRPRGEKKSGSGIREVEFSVSVTARDVA